MIRKLFLITLFMLLFTKDKFSICYAEKFTYDYRWGYDSDTIKKFNNTARTIGTHYVKKQREYESDISRINQQKFTLEQKNSWASTSFQSPQYEEELKKREKLLPEHIKNITYNLDSVVTRY